MSEPTTTRPVCTDASHLLPGRPGPPAIVLFWRAGDPRGEAMRSRFERAEWPPGYRLCAIDVTARCEACAWFEVGDEPMVAIIRDGVILALEHECSAESCARLLGTAQRQVSRLREEL